MEALDASKKAIRDGEVVLPRRVPLLEEFAEHLASDAKKIIEDEETGSKTYKDRDEPLLAGSLLRLDRLGARAAWCGDLLLVR